MTHEPIPTSLDLLLNPNPKTLNPWDFQQGLQTASASLVGMNPNSCSDMSLSPNSYLEGQGDLVNRLTMGISRVTKWVIGVINLLTKPP